ncbi:hypothetical protein [Gracilimonas sp.]|uniref:hypothetical protein n=1 Tax=Gracilimonas sp. TaxID=1974203 RepID=UPI0028721093|nr:hypothetical protein [Gracilimonas sp.]
MSEAKLSNLEKKKKELEEELVKIQGGIDKSIDEVKEGVSTNMDPKNIIRKHPLPAVGASVIIGFLLGRDRKDSSRVSSNNSGSNFGISRELKRMLAKKGLSLLMDYLDQQISSMREKDKPSTD